MSVESVESLYKIYQDGVKIRQDCRAEIARLMIVGLGAINELSEILCDKESEALARPNVRQNNLTFTNSSELVKLYWNLQDTAERWLTSVGNTLAELPQKSLPLRFNEPFDRHDTASVRLDYTRYTYSKDMGAVLYQYDFLNDKLERLLKIIEICENTDAAIAVPARNTPEEHKVKAVYALSFNDMTGELFLNDRVVYRCKTYSRLGDALIEAFHNPNREAKVSGNLASAVDAIRIPKDLKRLMFRCGKGVFKFKSIIADEDLRNNHLNLVEIEQEFQKLSE